MKNPYQIVSSRHITEKAKMLEDLHLQENNPSVAKCKNAKYVFTVSQEANKRQIKEAVQEIYKEKNIKVLKVNTLHAKRKPKKRGKGRPGKTSAFKKAVVTLEAGDVLEQE